MHIDIEFHKMLTGMVRTNCLSSKKDIMECILIRFNTCVLYIYSLSMVCAA